MSKPDNPFAFPRQDDCTPNGFHCELGMTLRDYFAGQALNQATRDVWEYHKPEDVAGRCYMLADAMLAERAKS